jgi:phage repressor protein C with HTH and peptisase S24 domain
MEPKYQHGDIIYVDPDVAPAHGRDVIVKLPGRNEIIFRSLVVEGEQRFVKSLNPNWPGPRIFPLGADARIIGTIIGKWVDV